ncbi:MAG TPA: S-methyl-5-thioribose-1-phosphate isomerase [Bacteroidales bacterium]|nr:S-methyl-5-thioribose-1-phosphate isomerase [Bacteroidales bacterium]
MKVKGRHFETIWIHPDNSAIVQIIDQRFLPFRFIIEDIHSAEEMYVAIKDMHLRGAPLIGAAGALGVYLALTACNDKVIGKSYITKKAEYLKSSRPTAINLNWAVDRVVNALGEGGSRQELIEISRRICIGIIDEERHNCLKIGEYGLEIIEKISREKKGEPVNILTHCNAGWLACIDYGTATAPIYLAHDKGLKVHVWVDETRPRNQGGRLTSWELQQHGVPCTVIADNTGGHLMQAGMVDMVIVGSDRASPYGDVVNKIGTYLKALAAFDNHILFYAALPSSTIDWTLSEGAGETPIEERNGNEVTFMEGLKNGEVMEVEILPPGTPVANYGFDITPARLVTGIITERGISNANKKSIFTLFPERNLNPVKE